MSKRGQQADAAADGTDGINWRPTQTGVKLYAEGNPDAWIHAEFEAGTPPERRLFMICEACGAVAPQRSKPGHATVCGVCDERYEHDER